MIEYTVHFQKGFRAGARSLHMVNVTAKTALDAIKAAKREFQSPGYKVVRVDHFEDGRLVLDA